MLFEVTDSEDAPRRVEVSGHRVTIGRDPTSDIVLDDSRCSRRHAVIENTRRGVLIRDAGSRNGVFLNGRSVRRSPLRAGDEIQLGNVVIRFLESHDPSRTPIGHDAKGPFNPETLEDAAAVSACSSDREPPVLEHALRASRRPLTILLVALAWWLVALSGAVALVYSLASAAAPMLRFIAALAGLPLVAAGVVMGAALLARAPWSRSAHLLLGGAGLASCILTLPSAVLVLYFLSRQSGRSFDESPDNDPNETPFPRVFEIVFSVGLVTSMALSLGLAYAAYSLRQDSLLALRGPRLAQTERAAVDRMRRMADAEEAFRLICNTGYADLAALLHPTTVMSDYPENGPAFITTELAFKRAGDHQFELVTEEPMPETAGCPTRRFRRYRYSATPVGGRGRHFVIGPKRVVHFAHDRPATFEDPFIPR